VQAFATIGILLSLLIGLAPLRVSAKCVSGAPPSYDDITAVMLKSGLSASNEGPKYTGPKDQLSDSAFWALFWDVSEVNQSLATYSQFNLRGGVGTFHLQATLADVTSLLQRDRLFELNPPFVNTTAHTVTVLSVRHCSVVTRIITYPDPPSMSGDVDPATSKLMSDLENLIGASKKAQLSAAPIPFEETLLFDR
jgi:hypothetical protein